MGEQSASRLEGDRYQHLLSGYELLRLLGKGSPFGHGDIEHPEAGSADDATLHARPGSSVASRYMQVKWHVDHRGTCSLAGLVAPPRKGSSPSRCASSSGAHATSTARPSRTSCSTRPRRAACSWDSGSTQWGRLCPKSAPVTVAMPQRSRCRRRECRSVDSSPVQQNLPRFMTSPRKGFANACH